MNNLNEHQRGQDALAPFNVPSEGELASRPFMALIIAVLAPTRAGRPCPLNGARASRPRSFPRSFLLHSSFLILNSSFLILNSSPLPAQVPAPTNAPVQDEDAAARAEQARDEAQLPSDEAVPAPSAYSFLMQLPPGVDVSVRVIDKSKEEKEKKSQGSAPPPVVLKMERAVRKGIVRVQKEDTGVKMPELYFVRGFCAFDDARLGINIRKSGWGDLYQPQDIYHFPELTWAEPKTRRVNPNIPKEEEKIEIYQQSPFTLEVDAATHRPLRFRTGMSEEWTYSYKESSTPLVLPKSLEERLGRLLNKPSS